MLLDFEKTKELLEKYQIPMVESLVIETIEQGIEFANQVGFPVVLKLVSGDVLHKIDKGLVKLNIQNTQDIENAFVILSQQAKNPTAPAVVLRHQPKDLNRDPSLIAQGDREKAQGDIIIQKQISGIEIFLGMKRDKSFGPVISFGLGGIFVEVLEDVVFGICPIEKKEAIDIIKCLKGYKILDGFRGQKGVDIDGLANILVSVSKLAIENENIQEIDFNPVMASENNILVVDAKMIL